MTNVSLTDKDFYRHFPDMKMSSNIFPSSSDDKFLQCGYESAGAPLSTFYRAGAAGARTCPGPAQDLTRTGSLTYNNVFDFLTLSLWLAVGMHTSVRARAAGCFVAGPLTPAKGARFIRGLIFVRSKA